MSVGHGHKIAHEEIAPPGGWNATEAEAAAARREMDKGLMPESHIFKLNPATEQLQKRTGEMPEPEEKLQ